MRRWTELPGVGIEVRATNEGAFWRHVEPVPHPEGEGPYASLEDAAKDGTDYAYFVNGRTP